MTTQVYQTPIEIGWDKMWGSYNYKCTINDVIEALKRAGCPDEIVKGLVEWGNQPAPGFDPFESKTKPRR